MIKNIVTICIVVCCLTSCKFIKSKGWFSKEADTLVAYQARMDSLRVADSIQAVLETERRIEQARQDSIRAIEEAERERLARWKYHIIVGSFKTPEYAEKYAQYYLNMGYSTEILMNEYNFNLVSARVFEDIGMALRQLENFRDTVELEAWLFINE